MHNVFKHSADDVAIITSYYDVLVAISGECLQNCYIHQRYSNYCKKVIVKLMMISSCLTA